MDMIFMTNPNHDIPKLYELVNQYASISELRINATKCELLPGAGQTWWQEVSFAVVGTITYLGIKVGKNSNICVCITFSSNYSKNVQITDSLGTTYL